MWIAGVLSLMTVMGGTINLGFDLFPQEMELVGRWDVSSSMELDGFRKAFQSEQTDGDLAFLTEAGLDPFADVEDIYFGFMDMGENEDSSFVAAIRFNKKLDLKNIVEAFAERKQESLQTETYRGVTLFHPDDPENDIYVTDQIEGEWALAGDLNLVKKGVDRFFGEGTPITEKQKLRESTHNWTLPHLFWLSGNVTMPGQAGLSKDVLLTVDYFNGIQLGGKIPYADEEEKLQINQLINMGSGLLMMMSQGQMNPSDLRVEEKEGFIEFHVTIPEDMLAALRQQAASMQKGSDDSESGQ